VARGHAYLDSSGATSVINALAELLRASSVETIILYFEKLTDNIRSCRSGYTSALVVFKFLKLFVGREDLSKQSLVDKL